MDTLTLTLTVGLPRSGKTWWATQQGCPVVSLDAIRLTTHGTRFWDPAEKSVWATAWMMVGALFFAGHDRIVVDACNLTRERRDFWRPPDRRATEHYWPTWDLRLHVIDTPKDVCMARANGDTVMLSVIDRMAGNAQWPDLADQCV